MKRTRYRQRNFGFPPRDAVGGAIDYRRLATQHRPTEPEAIAKEARRLHHVIGMTARDIAAALGLDYAYVLQLLLQPDHD